MRGALHLLPAAGLALLSLAAIAGVALQPGPPGTPVAVFFAPFSDGDAALLRVAAAGGEILRQGGAGSIVIARSDDAEFADRLYARGALLVASGLNGWGCAPLAGRAS